MSTPSRPSVLIGPMSQDPAESVSAVNRALVGGLQHEYRFVCSTTDRRFGNTEQARLNAWNLYYLAKHASIWIWNVVVHRPRVAHYAINGGMALWKGLLFLRIARLFGAKTVGHLHSGGFLTYWNGLSESRQAQARREFARFDAFIVLSRTWYEAMRDKVGVDPRKLHVVNNPIDAGFEAAALEMRIDSRDVNYLALGVMGRDKGVFELVDAWAQANPPGSTAKLYLVGPERETGIREHVQRHVRERGVDESVVLYGPAHGTAKLELFRQCSVSILPSYYENFPLVLLEAAAAGHAIITTPVGAVPEFFVDGQSARFVAIKDVGMLRDAIALMRTDAAERHRLAHNSRAMFCESLARGMIMNSLDRVYRTVLAAHTSDPHAGLAR